MKRVLYLEADDWEVVYVDGRAISQGHDISAMELLGIAERHAFTHSDVHHCWVDPVDEAEIEDVGNFPELQSELKGTYE